MENHVIVLAKGYLKLSWKKLLARNTAETRIDYFIDESYSSNKNSDVKCVTQNMKIIFSRSFPGDLIKIWFSRSVFPGVKWIPGGSRSSGYPEFFINLQIHQNTLQKTSHKPLSETLQTITSEKIESTILGDLNTSRMNS